MISYTIHQIAGRHRSDKLLKHIVRLINGITIGSMKAGTHLAYYQQPADRVKIRCLLAHILLEPALTTIHIEVHGLRTVMLQATTGRHIKIQHDVVLGTVTTAAMQLEHFRKNSRIVI